MQASHSLTFVTTEALVTEVIETVLRKAGFHPGRVDLRDVPGIYLIKVPTFIDPRAGANQPKGERVSVLAREILGSVDDGIVISDGAKGIDGVLSFQSAKGVNGLEEKDVYVIALVARADEVIE